MVGKKVSGDLYIHKSALNNLGPEEQSLLEDALAIAKNQIKASEWNVARISSDTIALLSYPGFDEEPFPSLAQSARIDMLDGGVSIRDFRSYTNPPILHRKELLVDENYPSRSDFEKLSQSLDEMDLFYDANAIGYRNQWFVRLKKHGIELDGHKIKKKTEAIGEIVERHKTAMVRYQLSQPTQLLLRHKLLTEKTTFFDYGCGQGHDVETLNNNGYQGKGWDPHFAPDNPIVSADVINLGFVLNVIESPAERKVALVNAWKLASSVLSVSVMPPGSSNMEHAKPYKDGFLTRRNTFQKYFTQEQLKDFIEETLDAEPLAVAPGIFFVFSDVVAKQEFLIRRYERDHHRSIRISQRPKPIDRDFRPDQMEKVSPILEHYAEDILNAGRPLHSNEVSPEIIGALKAERISMKRAEAYCFQEFIDREELEAIAADRRDDLNLYFALEMFSGRKPYRTLPKRLQYDIKAFWGSHANAQIEARQVLFSVGDKDVVQTAIEEALDEGYGYLIDEDQLQFHSSILKRLPISLRCYVACASVLFGDVESADLIKIHMSSGKLSLMQYENFSDPLPVLQRRVKVDMKGQNVHVFDYDDRNRQYLFMKSLFIPDDWPDFDQQSNFDREVSKIKMFDFSGYGPAASVFDDYLRDNKITIGDYRLEKGQMELEHCVR